MRRVALVNCTPHAIQLGPPECALDLSPSGHVARAAEERAVDETVLVAGPDGAPLELPIHRVVYGYLTGLPEPVAGTLYLVSALAARAARAAGRADVVVVDQTRRDAAGRIIGAAALARV